MSDDKVVIQQKRTSLTLSGNRQQVFVLPKHIVAEINKHRPQIVARGSNPTVQVVERNPQIKIAGAGPPGPPGPPGPSGGTIAPINYSFGDAPRAIYTPDVAGTITLCRVVPEVVFNGTNPLMKIGTVSDDDSILPTDYTSLKEDIEVEFTPDVHLAANEAVILTMLPGFDTTHGSGKIFLAFVPD